MKKAHGIIEVALILSIVVVVSLVSLAIYNNRKMELTKLSNVKVRDAASPTQFTETAGVSGSNLECRELNCSEERSDSDSSSGSRSSSDSDSDAGSGSGARTGSGSSTGSGFGQIIDDIKDGLVDIISDAGDMLTGNNDPIDKVKIDVQEIDPSTHVETGGVVGDEVSHVLFGK